MGLNEAFFGLAEIRPALLEALAEIGRIEEELNWQAETDPSDPDYLYDLLCAEQDMFDSIVNRLRKDLAASDEKRLYHVSDDYSGGDGIMASSQEEAWEEMADSFRDGERVEKTTWIDITVWPRDTEGAETPFSGTLTLDPPEPDCMDDEEHDWQSPYELLGGCQENPGVWGHGGGVVIRSVCKHCGRYKITDTWAQNPYNGEQGLHSVAYEEADEASLAWIAESE